MLLLLSHFSRVWFCATHRQQPTRLRRPWDSPGKNTGVGCHFLLQCMKVKSENEVVQLCPTPSDPMDCSLSGSSVHGTFQARVLEWGAITFSFLLWNSAETYSCPCYCCCCCLWCPELAKFIFGKYLLVPWIFFFLQILLFLKHKCLRTTIQRH